MTCTVEVRARADDIAEQLEAQPLVLSADVLEPAEGPRDEWTIEVVASRSYLPPEVALALATHNLRTQSVQTRPQSATTQIVATIAR